MSSLFKCQSKSWKVLAPAFALLLMVAMACGAPAAEDPTPGVDPIETPALDATPTSTPDMVDDPVQPEEPQGTLDFAWVPMESFQAHPRFADPSRSPYMASTAYETLGWADSEGEMQPRLAEWSMSEDATVWTFTLREGIPFHKGYGEMTVDDLIFSLESTSAPDSIHTRAGQARSWFQAEDGWVERVDDYTLQVHTGVPSLDPFEQTGTTRFSRAVWIVSHQQAEEQGEEQASRNAAGTGPWEIVEQRTGEFWRFEAVPNHWRKTPNFAEMVFWDIPEESTRMANFQTGQLDSFSMVDLDTLAATQEMPGAWLKRLPDAGALRLLLYGQLYIGVGTDDQRSGYDPDLPWVSADPDFESEEWARALMVREALSLAIDRGGIVDAILHGEGRPGRTDVSFGCCEDRLGEVGYEYDPDRARELLEEAGYGGGFRIQLNDHQRAFVGESQACEAVAGMWRSIGVDVNYTRVPYSAIRPSIADRSYQGAACMGGALHNPPIDAFVGIFRTAAIANHGIEHQWLEERIAQAHGTLDEEVREALEEEMGRFMYENFINFNIYLPNAVFPLSERLGDWSLKLDEERRFLSNYEFIPHGQ